MSGEESLSGDERRSGDGDREIELVLIAAVAENGVIGDDGGMPWHYPADLAHFKETTMGHPVILGRRTFESIAAQLDGPLPGRTNVVLSRSDPSVPEGVVVAGSVEEAVEAALAADAETAYVAGGATVYEQFFSLADRLVLTEVPEEPEGDTRFPEWDSGEWVEVERVEDDELAFVTYERR
jgi:dihydrofolate reductase